MTSVPIVLVRIKRDLSKSIVINKSILITIWEESESLHTVKHVMSFTREISILLNTSHNGPES